MTQPDNRVRHQEASTMDTGELTDRIRGKLSGKESSDGRLMIFPLTDALDIVSGSDRAAGEALVTETAGRRDNLRQTLVSRIHDIGTLITGAEDPFTILTPEYARELSDECERGMQLTELSLDSESSSILEGLHQLTDNLCGAYMDAHIDFSTENPESRGDFAGYVKNYPKVAKLVQSTVDWFRVRAVQY